MKRNLNIKITGRDGKTLPGAKTNDVYADYVYNALDFFGGRADGITRRGIGELADRVYKAKSPPKDVELSTAEVGVIIAALDATTYPSLIVNTIAKYLEAK